MSFDIISVASSEFGGVVDDAKGAFDTAIGNLDSVSDFSTLLEAQGAAANMTATVSAMTGALQSVTSATSTSAGKIGQ